MIKVENLTKYYGDFKAVDNISFEIGKGKVYGFLGPNGAGKSTTMNIIAGCLSPTEGYVSVGGHDIMEEPEAARRLIGYLPEQPPLYLNETPLEYLKFVGEAKGLGGDTLYEKIAEVIEMTGLDQMRNRLISALSKGYKQRVGIAQAILGEKHVEKIKNSDEVILSIDSSTVTALSWVNGEETLSFHKDGENWVYDKDDAFPVDADKIENLLNIFNEFGVSYVIEDVENYADYGLEDPTCTINIKADGEEYQVLLGGFSKMDEQRYVSIGDGKAYLVQTDPYDSFNIALKDMILNDED